MFQMIACVIGGIIIGLVAGVLALVHWFDRNIYWY